MPKQIINRTLKPGHGGIRSGRALHWNNYYLELVNLIFCSSGCVIRWCWARGLQPLILYRVTDPDTHTRRITYPPERQYICLFCFDILQCMSNTANFACDLARKKDKQIKWLKPNRLRIGLDTVLFNVQDTATTAVKTASKRVCGNLFTHKASGSSFDKINTAIKRVEYQVHLNISEQ